MSIRRILFAAGAGVLLIAGGIVTAQQPKGSAARAVLAAPDHKFLEAAAKGGHAAVELSKMAVEKASDPKVKEFAQRMVDDHTKINNDLEALAKQKGVSLPTTYAKDPAETRLSKMSGAAFAKAYMHDMVTDHEKMIAAFEGETKSGQDNDVKDFASKQLPTLRTHLEEAKKIQL